MPNLPPEIQREIFEIAVRSNHNDGALKRKLSLVAHHVSLWVDGLFYEVVSIHGSDGANKFLDLVDLKPPGFFATAVKTLLLNLFPLTETQAEAILSACTGVEALAVWNSPKPLHQSFLQISQLPLRRLSMRLDCVTNIITAPTPPIWLSSITHLNVMFGLINIQASNLENLKQLPRLTHVALGASQASTLHAQTVCASCPDLQVLLMLGNDDPPATVDTYVLDSRIVFAKHPWSTVDDWEAPHFGLPDMWTRAEHTVAMRKALAVLQPAE